MVRLYLWAGCCEAPPTSTATGNPITFCSIRLCVRPPSGTSAGVRSPVVRTGQRCRLVILWFRPEYTAISLPLILYHANAKPLSGSILSFDTHARPMLLEHLLLRELRPVASNTATLFKSGTNRHFVGVRLDCARQTLARFHNSLLFEAAECLDSMNELHRQLD